MLLLSNKNNPGWHEHDFKISNLGIITIKRIIFSAFYGFQIINIFNRVLKVSQPSLDMLVHHHGLS